MMSQLINSAVFPGIQGGPLEHCIGAKAVAFYEALQPEFKEYQMQVKKNAAAMAQAFIDRGYKIVSGGTDNHKTLVRADITVNKNMVPFDSRTPFTTSGIRVGTPAITSRGLVEKDMETIVELIDEVLSDVENEAVIEKVKNASHSLVAGRPLNVW